MAAIYFILGGVAVFLIYKWTIADIKRSMANGKGIEK